MNVLLTHSKFKSVSHDHFLKWDKWSLQVTHSLTGSSLTSLSASWVISGHLSNCGLNLCVPHVAMRGLSSGEVHDADYPQHMYLTAARALNTVKPATSDGQCHQDDLSQESVKCYRGGRKINLISPIYEIQSQMCYHCIQYTRRHHMSLISHF